ncbi:hypothetical protein BX616_008427, partial [Lobosporangium transversale]
PPIRIEPPRIAFYPDKALDVVTKRLQPGSSSRDTGVNGSGNSNNNNGGRISNNNHGNSKSASNGNGNSKSNNNDNSNSSSKGVNNVATHLPGSKRSTNLATQDHLPLSYLARSSNSSLVTRNNRRTEMVNSNIERAMELLQGINMIQLQLEAEEKDRQMLELQSAMGRVQSDMFQLQLEAIEKNDKILAFQSEIHQLQLEVREKGDMVLALQLEAKDRDDQMLELQNKALDKLATLQKHANAILVQNFELHEYPIPRLFIILPVDTSKWDPRNVLGNKFRLHFLCECGELTAEISKSSQNQIHLAKHDGYEVRDSTKFFRKYGRHMLIILHCLRVGAPIAACLAPIPNLTAAINYSIEYMEKLSIEYPVLKNINTIDEHEALEGADLRQLGTFLRIRDEDREFGNLEKEQKEFAGAVENNGGKYDPYLGKVIIALYPKSKPGEFFNVLANARRVYELDITFGWEWTRADLVAFEEALKKSSVSILRLDLGRSQESTTEKFLPISTRYETLVRIMGLSKMKTIHIVLSPDLIKLSSLQPKRPLHLHKLSFSMKPGLMEANDFKVFANSLGTNPALITLDLGGSSIEKERAAALSEALKTNTMLTTLNLGWNSIGKEGALVLSKALKTNKALATLSLWDNSIGKEGAQALSEALKENKALTTLELKWNSIGNEGARALSKALKSNTTLTALELAYNSIGMEGALSLSNALKGNTALTALCLEGNSVGDEGALALSEALARNTTLATLNLKGNSIEKKGALALSEALKTKTVLTTLDLESNSIGNEGAYALSLALKVNETLTTLELAHNSIGIEGAFSLSEALKTNMALTALGLGGNSIGSEGALALLEARKFNTTLSSLNFTGNSIGYETALTLSEAFKPSKALTPS